MQQAHQEYLEDRGSMSRSRFRPSTLLVLAAILAWVLLLLYMQTALDSLKQNDNAGQEHLQSPSPPPTVHLLSVAAAQKHNVEKDKSDDANVIVCTVTTDVRGNLGPAAVLLNNGTDWIKDRWQAASDMHGTNIQGPHWVQLSWTTLAGSSATTTASVPQNVAIVRIVLDWEAAYADHYDLQIQLSNQTRHTIVQSPLHLAPQHTLERNVLPTNTPTIRVSTYGQSPGVTSVTPLHVVHDIELPTTPSSAQQLLLPTSSRLRLMIYESATGWGVSLWQVQVYGWYL
jgi:hypothetical protein